MEPKYLLTKPLAGPTSLGAEPNADGTGEKNAEVRALVRELVRVLKDAQGFAQKISVVTGHPMSGDAPGTDLAETLNRTAKRICHELLGGEA